MSSARVLVGDVSGRIIADLEPELGGISWRLNKIGVVRFVIARTDTKATEINLHYGNHILFRFDNGLPDWGGIIDPPRTWTEDGKIECTAYSGEYLLGWRITDKGRYFSNETAGAIFSKLRAETDLPLIPGAIWTGGGGHSPDYHFDSLLEITQDSLTDRLENADFDVQAAEVAGKIIFTANFYERKGSDKSGKVWLIEAHNLTNIALLEQGTIYNKISLAGSGTTWGSDRITSYTQDADSIAEYGRREYGRVDSDVSLQPTLDAHAANLLSENKDPHNILALSAIDLAPAAFQEYDVGDHVQVKLHSFGFGGYDHRVRVLAREYNPADGTCALVVQEDDA